MGIDNIYLIYWQEMKEKMLIYPNEYFDKIDEITIEFLQKNKIKALILDMDNTLITINEQMPQNIECWAKELKGQGVKLIIVSNSNKKSKLDNTASKIGVRYVKFAKKPLKCGLKKAMKILGEKPENIAVVGDQIFTDIIGGNRCKMKTILIDSLEKKDFWYTAWKRPIEDNIKRKIAKEKE